MAPPFVVIGSGSETTIEHNLCACRHATEVRYKRSIAGEYAPQIRLRPIADR